MRSLHFIFFILFLTSVHGQVVQDVEGNEYPVVQIGTQWWIAENLRVSSLPDGTKGEAWAPLDDESKVSAMGRMYSWETACKVCPAGWHLPTDEEWQELIRFLGGEMVAGGKMKKTGTDLWKEPNKGATNESGFSAVPVGYRTRKGRYINFSGTLAYYWSATEAESSTAWGIYLTYGEPIIYRYYYSFTKDMGFSVRCVKD